MVSLISKFLTILFLLIYSLANGMEIWKENFLVPEKGIWGKGDGTILTDMSGITTWSIEYSSLSLTDANDYAKTVSTSGGRFEVRDINGEITWISALIDISGYETIDLELTVSETGSGANTGTKYLKVYYRIDGRDKDLLETNGENRGNWGKVTASQKNLSGNTLQVVAEISNHYAADKVILDDILVTARLPYQEAVAGDLAINEILFDPVPEGEDYVEIVNCSDKLISVKDLFLASRDKNSALTQIYNLADNDFPFYPGEYLALTRDTNGVFPWFQIKCPCCFLQMASFPSFNNDFDRVVLLNSRMEILDELYYSEKMHSQLLSDKEGVSLERISTEVPTNEPGNWFSASTDAGYGTPGYANSQSGSAVFLRPQITFEPEAFSPNLDGYKDEYTIHYNLDKPGYIVNAWIFDVSGNLVLQLARNIILGISGDLSWNGRDETGQLLSYGMYVVAVELFDTNGRWYHYKDGVVLTNLQE